MQRWCLRVSLRVISYRAPCNDARLYHTRRIVQSQPAAAPYKTQPAAAPYPANEIRSIRPYVAPIRPFTTFAPTACHEPPRLRVSA